MRYALTFGVLGIVLVHASVRLAGEAYGGWWLLVAVEGYLGICLLSLATVYGLRHFGVRIEDHLTRRGWTLWARALLLPYPVLARMTLLLTTWISREAMMSRVGPGLSIGRLPFSWERDRLVDS